MEGFVRDGTWVKLCEKRIVLVKGTSAPRKSVQKWFLVRKGEKKKKKKQKSVNSATQISGKKRKEQKKISSFFFQRCLSALLTNLTNYFSWFFSEIQAAKKVESFRKTFCSTFLCLRIVLIFTMFSSFIFVQNDEA